MKMFNPPHPGEALREALESLSMTVPVFAERIGFSEVELKRIVACEAPITMELSQKLSAQFGQPSLDIWFRIQEEHDEWQREHPPTAHIANKNTE